MKIGLESNRVAANTTGQLLSDWVYAGENPILRCDAAGNRTFYLGDASDSRSLHRLATAGPLQKVKQFRYDRFGNTLRGSTTRTSR